MEAEGSVPTRALCPGCGKLLAARKVFGESGVLLERACPEHGRASTRISGDPRRLRDTSFDSAGKRLREYPVQAEKGCPEDCGFCPSHGQHVCTALIEITGRCDMDCPICYAADRRGLGDVSPEDFKSRIDGLLRAEGGRLEVLQLSGGEPFLHPEIVRFLESAAANPGIGRILVNTNGERLLEDAGLRSALRGLRGRVEAYLQYDGPLDEANRLIRGRATAAKRRELMSLLDSDGVKMTLAATLFEKNLDQVKSILDLAVSVENVSGATFQRMIPSEVTQDEILDALRRSGCFPPGSLIPLPCSHRECTTIGFLFCREGSVRPVSDFIDYREHKAVLSDRIAFDAAVLKSAGACRCLPDEWAWKRFAGESRASSFEGMKVLRVVVKNFMDRSTFDLERARKCCVGVATASGRIVPFCVYNNLKRGTAR